MNSLHCLGPRTDHGTYSVKYLQFVFDTRDGEKPRTAKFSTDRAKEEMGRGKKGPVSSNHFAAVVF